MVRPHSIITQEAQMGGLWVYGLSGLHCEFQAILGQLSETFLFLVSKQTNGKPNQTQKGLLTVMGKLESFYNSFKLRQSLITSFDCLSISQDGRSRVTHWHREPRFKKWFKNVWWALGVCWLIYSQTLLILENIFYRSFFLQIFYLIGTSTHDCSQVIQRCLSRKLCL